MVPTEAWVRVSVGGFGGMSSLPEDGDEKWEVKLGSPMDSIKDPVEQLVPGGLFLQAWVSWAGLEKPGHSGFQTEGSVLGCLAAFSYLGEMLTSGTSEVPRSSSSMTGQAWDRYDQCCTSLGPERGSVLFSDPNLAAGEGAKVLALCSGCLHWC